MRAVGFNKARGDLVVVRARVKSEAYEGFGQKGLVSETWDP